MREDYLKIRSLLEDLQRNEAHHRLIGTKNKRGEQIPLDEICSKCPNRRPCWKISIAMSDLHNGTITPENALTTVTVALSQVTK